jgi:hypothetical protein
MPVAPIAPIVPPRQLPITERSRCCVLRLIEQPSLARYGKPPREAILKGEQIMSKFYQLLASIQSDRAITENEIEPICQYLDADGKLDLEDVKLLIELYCNADERCAAFDGLFFNVLEKVLLADGQISPSEEFYLLKMLYSDREIREPEREFLRKLRKQSKSRSASFEALFDTAMNSPAKNWSVGGTKR